MVATATANGGIQEEQQAMPTTDSGSENVSTETMSEPRSFSFKGSSVQLGDLTINKTDIVIALVLVDLMLTMRMNK